MPFCQVKGVDIHYIAAGSEANKSKSVVFIHGAGGNGKRWSYQLKAVSDEHYFVALDLPGHGQSGGNPCEQIFLYREWVKEFLDAMGIGSVVVAGHSMGGAIAQDLAVKYPEMIKGLILVATAARFKVDPARLEALARGEKYRPEWVRLSFSSSAPAELLDEFVAESQKTDPGLYYIDLLACNRFVMDKLNEIQVPTLVICGTEDVSLPRNFPTF